MPVVVAVAAALVVVVFSGVASAGASVSPQGGLGAAAEPSFSASRPVTISYSGTYVAVISSGGNVEHEQTTWSVQWQATLGQLFPKTAPPGGTQTLRGVKIATLKNSGTVTIKKAIANAQGGVTYKTYTCSPKLVANGAPVVRVGSLYQNQQKEWVFLVTASLPYTFDLPATSGCKHAYPSGPASYGSEPLEGPPPIVQGVFSLAKGGTIPLNQGGPANHNGLKVAQNASLSVTSSAPWKLVIFVRKGEGRWRNSADGPIKVVPGERTELDAEYFRSRIANPQHGQGRYGKVSWQGINTTLTNGTGNAWRCKDVPCAVSKWEPSATKSTLRQLPDLTSQSEANSTRVLYFLNAPDRSYTASANGTTPDGSAVSSPTLLHLLFQTKFVFAAHECAVSLVHAQMTGASLSPPYFGLGRFPGCHNSLGVGQQAIQTNDGFFTAGRLLSGAAGCLAVVQVVTHNYVLHSNQASGTPVPSDWHSASVPHLDALPGEWQYQLGVKQGPAGRVVNVSHGEHLFYVASDFFTYQLDGPSVPLGPVREHWAGNEVDFNTYLMYRPGNCPPAGGAPDPNKNIWVATNRIPWNYVAEAYCPATPGTTPRRRWQLKRGQPSQGASPKPTMLSGEPNWVRPSTVPPPPPPGMTLRLRNVSGCS